MILAREQINRYLRQIIIPEISGPGQKKLLETSVFLCGKSVDDTAPAIYYLAAAGIGSISCQFENAEGFDELAARIHDLNNDVSIQLANGKDYDFQIFFGRPEFIISKSDLMLNSFQPSLILLYSGWKGGLQVFKDWECLKSFLAKLSPIEVIRDTPAFGDSDQAGEIFSSCFLGALCAMEVIKLTLEIGERAAEFFSFNLLSMEMLKINQEELEQYFRELAKQTVSPRLQLENSRVLIVGTGGLGSPAAYALTLAGVGTIGLVDYDTVEISNLNRQILHSTTRIGLPKVESAALFLKALSPQIKINSHNVNLNKDNVFQIIEDYDAVILAVDNFPTRYLLNDACFFTGKPLIDAGVIRFDGTCMTLIPSQGHCYRCTFPDIPAPGSVMSCSESGVLGPVAGIMGFLQAAEVAKLLSGQGQSLRDRMIFFDGLFLDFRTITLSRQSNCPLCGTNPSIHELQEYLFFCSNTDNETDLD